MASDIYFYHKANQIDETDTRSRFNYGLCSSCKNLVIRKTRLRHEWAVCLAWLPDHVYPRISPSKDDVIEECSQYYSKLQMSIEDMNRIATLIDCNKKKTVGFASGSDETEIVITKPEDREEKPRNIFE